MRRCNFCIFGCLGLQGSTKARPNLTSKSNISMLCQILHFKTQENLSLLYQNGALNPEMEAPDCTGLSRELQWISILGRHRQSLQFFTHRSACSPERSNLWLLSRAVLGHHICRQDSPKNSMIIFQKHFQVNICELDLPRCIISSTWLFPAC